MNKEEIKEDEQSCREEVNGGIGLRVGDFIPIIGVRCYDNRITKLGLHEITTNLGIKRRFGILESYNAGLIVASIVGVGLGLYHVVKELVQ